MGKLNKIDSNSTGLRYCQELTLNNLPVAASQVWKPLEPNSYQNFGTQTTTVARNPINAGRQRKKGVVTDVSAAAGFQTDITQTNLQDLLQGFFFADAREKLTTAPLNSAATPITSVSATQYVAGAGLGGFAANDLIVASGFGNASNNGLRTVSASTGTTVTTVEANTIEASPPAAAKLSRIGHLCASGDITITVTGGNIPVLASTALDFTTLGLIIGEWIFIGGDTAVTQFATAANNGFARIRSIAAHAITLDKTANTMVTDAGAAKTIQIFFGRVFKNETGTLIKRRSYQLERLLGANNDTDLTKQQAEYLIGSIPNEFQINIPTAAKIVVDLTFSSNKGATKDENVLGANTLLSKVAGATAPTLVDADAFNTSSDVARINMSVVTPGNSFPTPLFAFVQDLQIQLKNNLVPNKAVGVTGAFEQTAGNFTIGGKLTAYFSDVAAVAAVQANNDITVDTHLVKANSGISFDIPLLTLGDGRPNVAQDQAITLPLSHEAATGAKIDANLNYTFLMVFWDYLPTLAHS